MNIKQRFIYQIINHETGNRSKPFTATIDELNESLDNISDSVYRKNYILLVATIDPESEEEQMHIPQSPLITIETFLSMFESAKEEISQCPNA